MTSIFREVPSNYYYLIIYYEEDSEADPIAPLSKSAKTYAETKDFELQRTSEVIKKNCCFNKLCMHYKIPRAWLWGRLFKNNITLFPFTFLFNILFGTETYFRKTLAMTLEKKNGWQDCNVTLCSVTYLELCFKTQLTNASSTLRMYGESLSMTSTPQVTLDLGCQYKVIWVYQRKNYSPFNGMDDTNRVAPLCVELLQLQKSDAVFSCFCCGLYRHLHAWLWDKRSFTSQQQF